MNYLKAYCNLIRKAEKRGYTKKKAKELGIYVEGHHVFPKSIFGKNHRVVYLTSREHYVSHALLMNVCIKRYGIKNWKSKKMIYAFWIFNNRNLNKKNEKNLYFSSRLYEKTRLKFKETVLENSIFLTDKNPSKNPKRKSEISEYMSSYLLSLSKEEYIEKYKNRIEKTKVIFKGEGNPFYNKTHTQEVKDLISKLSREGKWWNNGKENRKCKECPGEGWVRGRYFKNNPRKNKKLDPKIVEKVRKSNCKYIYIFTSPEGNVIESPYARDICLQNNLNYGCVIRLARGERKTHKGWKVSRRPRTTDDK